VRYTPYHHLVSSDLVEWEELPVALPIGGPDDIDMSLGTGSVIEKDGRFYLLYCGRVFAGDPSTGPRWEGAQKEVTCLATSDDLVHWTKRGDPVLVPENSPYTVSDFRDPYPFWNEEDGQYWMVVATQTKDAGVPFRGALALATSNDLVRWEFASKPFWAPNVTGYPLECPDVFRLGRKWYLFFSADGRTSYRVADSPSGPWEAPEGELWEAGHFYAAKTMGDERRRLLVGWLGTKPGWRDLIYTEWGGEMMIPRDLVPRADGSLAMRCPKEIVDACGPALAIEPQQRLGEWKRTGGRLRASRTDGLAYAILPDAPSHLLLECTLSFEASAGAAGILFRASRDLNTHYSLRVEPSRYRVSLERWPRAWELPFLNERALSVRPGAPVKLQLFVDGDIVEAFVDDQVAMCARIYDYRAGDIGLFASHASVSFDELRIRKLP